MAEGLYIYIHIPFCERKCSYCSFASLAGKTAVIPAYFTALEQEITRTIPRLDKTEVNTIYIGGGTPSCIPAEYIVSVLHLITSRLPLRSDAEITVECNPHSLQPAWIDALLSAGVTRFSLGVQALNDTELAYLGRLHDTHQAKAAYALLQKYVDIDISIDLMYGIPEQTEHSWNATLNEAAEKWHPGHISLYGLSIEPGTRFSRWKKTVKHDWQWPDDDTMMDWYWQAAATLDGAGYARYEISNYAVPGHESRHNQCYWNTKADYIGFGAAAHSFCILDEQKKRRFRNIKNVLLYIQRIHTNSRFRVFSRPLSHAAACGEELLLGLRRSAGVTLRAEHRELFGPVITRQVEDGLIQFSDTDTITLTDRGIELSNMVMSEYV